MRSKPKPHLADCDVIVIGAGIGGLASAARLAAAGLKVIVVERHAAPGGKMRTLPSSAGPVDTGPTVLTMRSVFDDLFRALGARLEDHVTLVRQHLIARHFWPDGSKLDLFDDPDLNSQAIRDFAGPRAVAEFQSFSARAQRLFEGFDAPMMQSAEPRLPNLVRHVISNPGLIRDMATISKLAGLLASTFQDRRLAQLFGRYATYVGGSPYQVPALLALIWQAEVAGVWAVRDGMQSLAQKIADLSETHGAEFLYNTHVEQIEITSQRVSGVTLRCGSRISANTIVFNGDPRALATGLLGHDCSQVARQTTKVPRSLSAEVYAFAATPHGPDLAHHNVFFRSDPKPEFDALMRGGRVIDPTLYVCAMDRGLLQAPPLLERFETIANAPPIRGLRAQEETNRCQTRTFRTLENFGLRFTPEPGQDALTTPSRFDRLFPGSNGSLYGQSPHGTMAAFQRPTAKTRIPGLFLAGGGAHPGAGVPMATLSGKHAAEAILQARTLTSRSRQTAMRGGMSTVSGTTGGAPSRSSPS